MNRLVIALAMFAFFYSACIGLYWHAVGAAPPGETALWYIWFALGAACLSATANELTMFVIWLWQKATRFSADGGVPLHLTSADRHRLARYAPTVAMLMPAHNEATTPEDRAGLVERICDMLMKTPRYCVFFLLADSPPDQRVNEMHVIERVKARLRAAGRPEDESRLRIEEYRDKPQAWRNKQGSVLRWVRKYASEFEFMFILDADSSLPDEDRNRPQTCDVLNRMVLAMLRDRNLAVVQSAMHIDACRTPWAWVQAINARIGTSYYLPAFAWLYQRATPCYGHNCLIRVGDFALHARNSLCYTSHDHIEAGDFAAAGRGCVLSNAVLTHEGPEETLPLWLKRECRWSRGNGQWIVYLMKKPRLPLAPAVFLGLGFAQYTWALLGGLFLAASAAILFASGRIPINAAGPAPALLIAMITCTLLAPRLAGSGSPGAFFGGTLITLLLSPALTLYQGIFFILGAFGSRWVPRGARAARFDWRQVLWVAWGLIPAMLLGLTLWILATHARDTHWAAVLLDSMILFMIASPFTAAIVSRPWRRAAST